MNIKKEFRRKQGSLYLSEDEKDCIEKFAKSMGRPAAQLIRDAILTIAKHPEYHYILNEKDLFNLDPKEVDLVQKLLPEVTKLVKTINEITTEDNSTQE